MSHQVLSRIGSEPNWIAICSDQNKPNGISFHPVCGWAIVTNDGRISYLPTLLSGEIISDRSNYLGLIGPNDNYEERTSYYMNFVTKNSDNHGHLNDPLIGIFPTIAESR